MKLHLRFIRLGIAAGLFCSLAACTVVPAHPHAYYGGPPVVVDSYPAYRNGYPYQHYDYDRRAYRGYDDRGGRRHDSPLESAARTHRDVRRSLGLPRLPGMP